MPNSYRLDELTARMKAALDADVRKGSNLSEVPVVYDQVPMPQTQPAVYQLYIEPVDIAIPAEQPKTAMAFQRFFHTFRLWLVVYNSSVAVARSDWAKFLDNVMLILGDLTNDGSSYWYHGLMTTIAPSATHQNIEAAGDVRVRCGYVDFTFIQEKNL